MTFGHFKNTTFNANTVASIFLLLIPVNSEILNINCSVRCLNINISLQFTFKDGSTCMEAKYQYIPTVYVEVWV